MPTSLPEGSNTRTALAPMSATTQLPDTGLTTTDTGSLSSRWLKLVISSPSKVSSASCLQRGEILNWLMPYVNAKSTKKKQNKNSHKSSRIVSTLFSSWRQPDSSHPFQDTAQLHFFPQAPGKLCLLIYHLIHFYSVGVFFVKTKS